jgi:hypothetical protein
MARRQKELEVPTLPDLIGCRKSADQPQGILAKDQQKHVDIGLRSCPEHSDEGFLPGALKRYEI